MKRAGTLAVNLLLAGLSLAVCVVLAEQLLRAIGYERNPLKIQLGEVADARLYHVFEDRNFVYDPDLIWRPKRDYGVFNAQGYRGPEVPDAKPEGSWRIFAIGDSNTLGWGGAGGANWPETLHNLLRQRDPRFSVVNAGVYGYTSQQGLIRFRRSLIHRPDLALISFGSNDGHPVTVSDRDFIAKSLGRSGWTARLARFRLGQLFAAAWTSFVSWRSGGLTERVPLEDYRSNLNEFVRLAREQGIAVVLLTRPYVSRMRSIVRWKTIAHHYNAVTAEVAEQQDVSLIDLYSQFKGRKELFADESHFTGEGHRRAAEIVLEALEPLLR